MSEENMANDNNAQPSYFRKPVTVTAPTRIDLAGGTLDLYPLYLFLDRPLTVNASLNLRSKATVTPLPGRQVELVSADLDQTVTVSHPDQLELGGTLDLLARAVKFYAPQGGLRLVTRSSAPKGSGLGASSSLLMSISKALSVFSGREDSMGEIIQIGSALEAQNLGIPTGLQDYYGAFLGGINGICFRLAGNTVRTLYPSDDFMADLRSSIIVSFTQISHFSGNSNWEMLKRFIDKNGDTVERMLAIEDTAHQMWDALIEEDLNEVANVLNIEWDNRRGLADGVTTSEIDYMIESAKNAGALASKLCGAGGGGCLLTLARPDKREEVIQALEKAGATILDANLDPVGLKVEE